MFTSWRMSPSVKQGMSFVNSLVFLFIFSYFYSRVLAGPTATWAYIRKIGTPRKLGWDGPKTEARRSAHSPSTVVFARFSLGHVSGVSKPVSTKLGNFELGKIGFWPSHLFYLKTQGWRWSLYSFAIFHHHQVVCTSYGEPEEQQGEGGGEAM